MSDEWSDIPLATTAGKDKSAFLSDAELVNLMVTPTAPGSRKPFAIVSTPNFQRYGNTGAGAVRGLGFQGDHAWYAIGNKVYVHDGSSVTTLTGTLTNSTGPVQITGVGTNLVAIAEPGAGSAVRLASLTALTSNAFPAGTPYWYAAQDGFVIAIRGHTNEWYISALDDPTTWNALDFSTFDSEPDTLVAVFSRNREVVLVGKRHIEFWYNAGSFPFPFARSQPGVEQRGAIGACACFNNTIYFLGSDRRVYALDGYRSRPISTPWIEQYLPATIASGTTDMPVGSIFVDQGQAYYVLSFPAQAFDLLVYNITIDRWHRWTPSANNYTMMGAGNLETSAGKFTFAALKNGTMEDIVAIRSDYYRDGWLDTDNGNISRQITCPAFEVGGNRVFEHEVHFDMERTVGIEGTARFDYSDDGGANYKSHGANAVTSVGTTKTTNQARVRYARCGSYRRRNHRAVIKANARVAINAIRHRFEVGI